MIGPTNDTNGVLPSCPTTKKDKADDRRYSIQKRKKMIKTCLGIVIWMMVCVPSNIMAIIFYVKQTEVVTGTMDDSANMFINTNGTTRGMNEEEKGTKLTNSATIINQVSLNSKLN